LYEENDTNFVIAVIIVMNILCPYAIDLLFTLMMMSLETWFLLLHY